MTDEELSKIAAEIRDILTERMFGRLFPLSRTSFAADFHPHAGAYLFIDLSPRNRSVYLIVRKLKLLERSSVNPNPFHLKLREHLAGFTLDGATAVEGGMLLKFSDSNGKSLEMLVRLLPSPSNLVLINENRNPILSFREDNLDLAVSDIKPTEAVPVDIVDFSASLDEKRLEIEAEERFQTATTEAKKSIAREIAKRKKALANLDADLAKHGDADSWKKFGDLILASLPSPKRVGGDFVVVDFFDPELPEISIPAGDDTPNAAAERYYKKYRKASNAVDAIAKRKTAIEVELDQINSQLKRIENAIESRDIEAITAYLQPKQVVTEQPKKERSELEFKGARRFASSDGYEILVGKRSQDNDHLTFRIAKSHDTWLHAADYPGSHVVIRNPNRRDIPQKTLLEAAAVAAFYSDAREIPKAAVNHTLKKFVNKPRRAAPGLVSLSKFKTILVKPEIPAGVQKVDG